MQVYVGTYLFLGGNIFGGRVNERLGHHSSLTPLYDGNTLSLQTLKRAIFMQSKFKAHEGFLL